MIDRTAIAFTLVLAGLAAPAAATTVLEPVSRGCVDATTGNFSCANSNTPLGNHFTGLTENFNTRSFYIFDLSAVTEPVASASLAFDLDDPRGVSSAQGSEALGFFLISDASRQKLLDGLPDVAVFGDLGTGVNLGYPTFEIADRGMTVDEALGSLWIDAINDDRGGLFAVGAAVITLDGVPDPDLDTEGVFGDSGGSLGAPGGLGVRLTLEPAAGPSAEIPLPATAPALLLGLGALALGRRRSGATRPGSSPDHGR